MKRIVFNGCWVGTNVVGVSRYAYNIIKELDKLLENSKDKYYVSYSFQLMLLSVI